MGPRLLRRGRLEGEYGALRPFAPASMGPRLLRRGRARSGWASCCCRRSASMGPRLLRRGRTPAALAALVEGGQRFNGAAAVTPRKVRYREGKDRNRASLQWGRGCYAAEGATADTAPCSRPDSFNGAAAVTPRKEKPVKLELSRAVRFNGAAAVTPRKGMEAAAGGAMLTHASMGPRLLRRGRRSTRTMRRTMI